MPPLTPRVRDATEADVPPLVAMMRLFDAGDHERREREHLVQALASLTSNPRLGRVSIADTGGEPLGYALVTFAFDLALGGPAAHLAEIYVRPAARRRGLGALLLAHAERVAAGAGARRLRVSIAPENELAFALCRGRGYEPSPRIPFVKDLSAGTTHDGR